MIYLQSELDHLSNENIFSGTEMHEQLPLDVSIYKSVKNMKHKLTFYTPQVQQNNKFI